MPSKISYSYIKPDSYYEGTRAEMLRYIPENVKKTLEIGCGYGFFSKLVKDNFNAECWAVEINDKAAQIASEKLDKVIKGDANKSLEKLPENYFDCVILNDVLGCIADPFYLLENIKRKLNSKGIVVASIPNVRHWNNLRAFAWRGEWDYRQVGILDSAHVRFYTYKSLGKIFQKLGYEILIMEGIRPTRNKKFKVLNFLLWNKLWDAKYTQFACVIKPKSGGTDV